MSRAAGSCTSKGPEPPHNGTSLASLVGAVDGARASAPEGRRWRGEPRGGLRSAVCPVRKARRPRGPSGVGDPAERFARRLAGGSRFRRPVPSGARAGGLQAWGEKRFLLYIPLQVPLRGTCGRRGRAGRATSSSLSPGSRGRLPGGSASPSSERVAASLHLATVEIRGGNEPQMNPRPPAHPRTDEPQAAGLGFRGGAEGNRTPDLFHAMEALYQLSYSPVRTRQVSCGDPPVQPDEAPTRVTREVRSSGREWLP